MRRADGSSVDGMVLGLLRENDGFALFSGGNEVHVRWSDVTTIEKAPPPAPAPIATPAPVPAPLAPARAKSFGQAESFEAGIASSYLVGTVRLETDRIGTSTERRHEGVFQPFFGYFTNDSLEWIARATIQGNGRAFTFGGAYHFHPAARVWLGPELAAGARMRSYHSHDENGARVKVNEQGPSGFVGLRARLAVGGSALLSAGAGYYLEAFSRNIGSGVTRRSGSGTEQGLETGAGLSFFF